MWEGCPYPTWLPPHACSSLCNSHLNYSTCYLVCISTSLLLISSACTLLGLMPRASTCLECTCNMSQSLLIALVWGSAAVRLEGGTLWWRVCGCQARPWREARAGREAARGRKAGRAAHWAAQRMTLAQHDSSAGADLLMHVLIGPHSDCRCLS